MKFRDVYPLLQKIRNFLIMTRTPHLKHNRFMPMLAPRSIPKPDIPRGPDRGYANQYYYNRHARNSVHPPIIGPVGIEAKGGSKIVFPSKPTPGCVYWFDAHCYYECVPDYVPPKRKRPPPPVQPPPRKRPDPPEDPPYDPCDPCQPPKKAKRDPCECRDP